MHHALLGHRLGACDLELIWCLELGVWCFDSTWRLSTPFHKHDHVCCAAFGFWRGATREHSRQRSVTEAQQSQKPNATQPSGRRFFLAFGNPGLEDAIPLGLNRTAAQKMRRARCDFSMRRSPSPSHLWDEPFPGANTGGLPQFAL